MAEISVDSTSRPRRREAAIHSFCASFAARAHGLLLSVCFRRWHRRLACAELPGFPAQAGRLCHQTHVQKQPLRRSGAARLAPLPTVLFALSLVATLAVAQNGRWIPGPGIAGIRGNVFGTAEWDPDGAGPQQSVLICGGAIQEVGNGEIGAPRLVSWDGKRWSRVAPPPGVVAEWPESVDNVSAVDNDVYVSGRFTDNDGIIADLAQLSGNGWRFYYGLGGPPRTVARYRGDLIVGGSFPLRLGKLVGHDWFTLGEGVDWDVNALAVFNDRLYVGGSFTNAGGQWSRGIAAWNGERWIAIGVNMPGSVSGMTVWNNNLVIVGEFTGIDGVAARNVARFDGSSWHSMGSPDVPLVAAFTINNQLYVGGSSSIASWDGSNWQTIDDGAAGGIDSLGRFRNQLVASGQFGRAGDVAARGVALWDGSRWSPLTPGVTGPVMAMMRDGKSLIVGTRDQPLDLTAALMSFDSTTRLWTTLTLAESLGTGRPEISAITRYRDRLTIGGEFNRIGGGVIASIATRVGEDWQSLIAPQPLPPGNSAVMLEWNSNLYTAGTNGGLFVYNGVGWSQVPRLTGIVSDLLPFGDELIIAGTLRIDGVGSFSQALAYNGSQLRRIGLESGTQMQSGWSLAIYDNKLIVGGTFTSAGTLPASRIAAWDGTPGGWSALGTGIGGSGVDAICVHRGLLFVGGNFTRAGSLSVRNIARWTGPVASGSWSAVGPAGPTGAPGLDNAVTSMVSLGGELVVGGWFGRAGMRPSRYVAHWNECAADFDANGQVDFFDYLEFIATFAAGDDAPDDAADFDANGQVDFFDYLEFIAAFAAGC
jgi:trimeric autotransporter adhesin